VSYNYDSGTNCGNGIGRLCQVTDAAGTSQFQYDAFGNVTQESRTESGVTYTTSYQYDAANRITSVTYPDGRIVNYTRDSLGRIQSVSTTVNGSTQTIVSNRTYRADGLLTGETFGNGVNDVRQYDLQGRLTYLSLTGTSGSIDTRLYSYDPNSNLTQKQSLPEVGNYTYDALDRITGTTRDAATEGYHYDPNGNRTSFTSNGTTQSYSYLTNTNRLTQVGTSTISTDTAGNITADEAGRSLSYNNAGRLSQVMIAGVVKGAYLYDYQGRRTRKSAGGVTTIFHYDPYGKVLTETDSTGALQRSYVWAEDQLIGQIEKETPAPDEYITDNTAASFTGTWPTSTSVSGYYGTNYQYHAKGTGKNSVVWTPNVPTKGSYQLYARWVAQSTNATNATYSIKSAATRAASVSVNQQANGGQWVSLGTYTFNAGTTGTITLTDKANGTAIADAIRLFSTTQKSPVAFVRSIHTDQEGTPRLATNGSQTKVWSWEGEACGNTAPTGTVTVNHRFPGQYADQESGLFYNWNRYFDPGTCRYVTSDPIGLAGGLNTYSYANDNPLVYIDPEGLSGGPVVIPSPGGPVVLPPIYLPGNPALPGAGSGSGPKSGASNESRSRDPDEARSRHDRDNCGPDCTKASPYQLLSAGITDEHEFKNEHGARPNSRFDICACKDGSVVIKAQGGCGSRGPSIETGHRWK